MADLNIIVSAETAGARRQLAQLQAQVKNTSSQFSKSTGVHNQYGKQLDKNTRGLSTFAKSGLQQTGYQLGDFAVQLQGGTSFMQAFGQQGSQLLQIFGPFGALAGAAVAIVGALGTAFMKSRDMAGDFSDEIEGLNTLITTANGITGTAEERYDRLEKKYGAVTETVKKLANAEAALIKIRLQQAMIKTRDSVVSLASSFSGVNREIKSTAEGVIGFNSQSFSLATRIVSLGKEFGITSDGVKKLSTAFEEFKEIDNAAEATRKAAEILKILKDEAVGPATEEVLKLKEALVQMGLSTAELDRILEVMTENKGVIEKNTQAVSILGDAFGVTARENDGLAKTMAQSMGDSFKSIVTGTKSTSEAFKNMAKSIIDQLFDVLIIQRMVGMVGTGGAGSGGTGLAGMISGTRAMGGPVTAGQTYLVGERGPELFTSSSSGQITPNNQMQGGGVTVVQNLNISAGVAGTVRTELATLLPQIQDAAKAAVLDARLRGGTYGSAFGG